MRSHRPSLLLVLILLLAATAGGLVLSDGLQPTRSAAGSREFQELVGGLGFGPAVDLSQCENAFDPRLCPHCSWEAGPIPAGSRFCPQHGSSVFYYPSLPPRSADSVGGHADAGHP